MGLIGEPGNFPVTEFSPKCLKKFFWSDTPKEDSEKHAFYVDFYNGFIDFDYKGNRLLCSVSAWRRRPRF